MKNSFKIMIVQLLLISTILSNDCYTIKKIQERNNFAIVIDKSGSMSGNPISDAISAISNFIKEMNINDNARIISFSDMIDVNSKWTSNKTELNNSLNLIQASGGTHLYDAIAKAFQLLSSENGKKIVVFLSDGEDGGSKFRLNEIINMNASEGVFVYSIGLGNFNKNTLKDIAEKTNGDFYHTTDSKELKNLYQNVISEYYQKFVNKNLNNGSIQVNSFPSNKPVLINNILKGKTPLNINLLNDNNYKVLIEFDRGVWECQVDLKEGYLAEIEAREDDLGQNLKITSVPHGSSVFLDDVYMGITSIRKNNDLLLENIPRGKHKLRFITFPESEGLSESFEFYFSLFDKDRSVKVSIYEHSAIFSDGEKIKKIVDPFEELD